MDLEHPALSKSHMVSRAHRSGEDHTFLPRSLIMATLPHRAVDGLIWQRRAGDFTLLVRAHPKFGLPFGVYPRLLAMWLTNEIRRTAQRSIVLEGSYHAFLSALGLHSDGLTRRRFRDQANRLLTSAISFDREQPGHFSVQTASVTDTFDLWWNAAAPLDEDHHVTRVIVSEVFYRHVMERSVPLDIRVIRVLQRAPLALDIYAWLTYRYSYLRRDTMVPWLSLYQQFGSDYKRIRNFRRLFRRYLVMISRVYPDARFEDCVAGVLLKPSLTSVRRFHRRPV